MVDKYTQTIVFDDKYEKKLDESSIDSDTSTNIEKTGGALVNSLKKRFRDSKFQEAIHFSSRLYREMGRSGRNEDSYNTGKKVAKFFKDYLKDGGDDSLYAYNNFIRRVTQPMVPEDEVADCLKHVYGEHGLQYTSFIKNKILNKIKEKTLKNSNLYTIIGGAALGIAAGLGLDYLLNTPGKDYGFIENLKNYTAQASTEIAALATLATSAYYGIKNYFEHEKLDKNNYKIEEDIIHNIARTNKNEKDRLKVLEKDKENVSNKELERKDSFKKSLLYYGLGGLLAGMAVGFNESSLIKGLSNIKEGGILDYIKYYGIPSGLSILPAIYGIRYLKRGRGFGKKHIENDSDIKRNLESLIEKYKEEYITPKEEYSRERPSICGGMSDVSVQKKDFGDYEISIFVKSMKDVIDTYDRDIKKQFKKQADVEAYLMYILGSHKNFIYIHTYDKNEIIMPYMSNISLDQLLDIIKKPLPLKVMGGIIYEICNGLKYMHEKEYVHRDIKPSNILLTYDGFVKIGDLGIAKIEGEDDFLEGSRTGTPGYTSPEIMLGAEKADNTSDIYCIGSILYRMATGKTCTIAERIKSFLQLNKFNDNNDLSLEERLRLIIKDHKKAIKADKKDVKRMLSKSGIPRLFKNIALKSLEIEPNKRYQNSGEISVMINDKIGLIKESDDVDKIIKKFLEPISFYFENIVESKNLYVPKELSQF